MIKGSRYQPPKAPFSPGDRVRYRGQTYTVLASTHTHSQLEGQRWALPNWELRKVRIKAKAITKGVQTSA